MRLQELQFDGIVGSTHNYAGLSRGNRASEAHEGLLSNPRAAARQGLDKMWRLHELGAHQAVLPPHERPSLVTLRSLGFAGSDEQVIAAASASSPFLLRACSSASAMWAANAATVTPSPDSRDGRVHFTVANLQTTLHRSIEASFTERVLRLVFAEPSHFAVHPALASCVQLADEGDANHLRLTTSARTIHAFAWGRGPLAALRPRRHPARQTLEASQAIARLHGLAPQDCVFPQQHPDGIDAGAFHTDVLAVASGPFLMLHDLAFTDATRFVDDLRRSLGEELFVAHASNAELPVARAIAAYPFNSQVIGLPDGSMTIVAPADAREDAASRAFLERVADAGGPVRSVHYVDVRQSMQNGGGPACLRLRVPLAENEASSLRGRVRLDAHLYRDLCAWVERWYRDRLSPDDLADPALAREGMEALDELTKILALGSLYDFQHG